MDSILNFITQNYLWFLVIAIILLLALIGYFVDVKKDSDDSPFKKEKNAQAKNEEPMANVKVENNMSLNEMINNAAAKQQNNSNNNANNNEDSPEGINMNQ